jgi:DNA helicase IV
MIPKSAELAEEQGYFDRAAKHRDRGRAAKADAPEAAADKAAARSSRLWAKRKKDNAPSRDSAVAFGRTDDNEGYPPLYIGNELIRDEDGQILVINWQTPAAERFYKANHDRPLGLARKRTFQTTGNVIDDFQDLVFAALVQRIEELVPAEDTPTAEIAAIPGIPDNVLDGALLAELQRERDGAMRSIAATIHAAQYDLIQAPLDQVLVIEGGPGTGKTAVALHRVSYLLYNHRDRLSPADVLVVGPHPAFTRYTRMVLPGLGDVDVEQVDVGMLAPAVRRGRSEPPKLQRLKGDARMAGVLRRGLEGRVGSPEPAERLLIDGRFVTLSAADVSAVLNLTRQAAVPYAQRRQLLREHLLQLVRDRGATLPKERYTPVDNLVERLWPQLTAAAFLRDLLGSRARLTAAAGHELTAAETGSLHRRGADRLSNEVWTAADLPLLDEAEELINGLPRRYAHIVLDEAQDLSPMQLRSVARRSSTGSLTVAGDLAQSTGVWARDRWDEVTAHLPGVQPLTLAALPYGYRVPRQVYEFAARLLPIAAPGVPAAKVVRDGPARPGVHRVEEPERAGRAVAVAVAHATAGRFVGIVCPTSCRASVESALAANDVSWSSADRGELTSAVNLVSPQEAKGLEFDAVVVVEPEQIVASDERGHRLLYVALTRTTQYLDIVCSGDPLPLKPWRRPVVTPATPRTGPPVDPAELERLANTVAAHVRGGVPAPMWFEVLQRAAELLEHPDEHSSSGRHRR